MGTTSYFIQNIMASSREFDSEGVLESESVLTQIYKIASRDISPAQRIVRSLPLICELLATNIDLKGPQFKVCLDILGLNLDKLLSLLIYTQDWTAVEALTILLDQNNFVSAELIAGSLLKPDRVVMRELPACCTLQDMTNLYDKLEWSVQHAVETGSVLPLDFFLRLMGSDYEKRNCTFGVDANTLLHLSCSAANTGVSKFPFLPIWLLGWGVEPNMPNKDGRTPMDLISDDSLKDIFTCLSKNKWIKDLAYMDFDAVRQFLLQQLCTSGQWLDMSVLIERLKCLTNEDYTAALLALQRKRWNTACKALLDSVGVNTDGLLILKSALEECEASAKRDVFISIVHSVCWRLRYESVDVPFIQPEWLKQLVSPNKLCSGFSGDYSGPSQESVNVTRLLKASRWYNRITLDSDKSYPPKSPKKSKASDIRTSNSSGSEVKNLQSYELEVCEMVKLNGNTAIFMPHFPSHVAIAAGIIKRVSSESHADSPAYVQDTFVTHKRETLANKENSGTDEVCGEDGDQTNASDKGPIIQIAIEETERVKEVASGSFYKQQRKKRSRQRQRNNTVSEETLEAQPKLEYKKKHRRRTKSSSDTLTYLEDDFSVLGVDDLGGQDDIVTSFVSKRAILVVVPSGKTVASTVTKLRSLTRDMTITEHAGCSKPKIGLRKLLRSSDVVVSHLPAVRNGIKSKSFAVKDVSLLVLLDLCYSDDLFSVVPNKTECGPDIVMIFKEFPYRSDVCSLESILQYVKAKLYLTSIITVSCQTKHVLKVMYPDVVYKKDIVPVTDLEKMTRLLKEYMSTTYGIYGKIEGYIVTLNLTCSSKDFGDQMTEECLKLLPSSFQISPIDTSSSRKIKEVLFQLSSSARSDKATNKSESKQCNFCAFVTGLAQETTVETLSAGMLTQLCIDQLRCQQFIRVL